MNNDKSGICRLSVVPVRAEASDKSELITQLLFGDHYSVIQCSEDGKWLQIEIAFDSYRGWIDMKQHHAIQDEYFEYLNRTDFKICTDIVSSILYKKQLIQIPIGSVLPITSSELFAIEEQLAFNGEAKNMGERRDFEYLRQIAMKYKNAPYLWGGKTPFGIDCSAFVQQVYRICGYRLQRDASQQFQQLKEIHKFNSSIAGDLAFFSNENGEVVHVGIVLEDNKIIHASGKVRVDQLTEEGIVNKESKIITHTLCGIKRILV
jgi:hypothetical protein